MRLSGQFAESLLTEQLDRVSLAAVDAWTERLPGDREEQP